MARSLLTRTSNLLLPKLLLLLCAFAALAPSGCGLLFPDNDVRRPDRDRDEDDTDTDADVDVDDGEPSPKVKDPHKVRRGITNALSKDKVTKTDMILLFGVFDGVAAYVDGLEEGTSVTTGEAGLGANLKQTLDRIGWPNNKYKAVKAEIGRAWSAYGLDEAQSLSDEDAKADTLAMFRLLAAGCRDVLERK